MSSVSYLIHKSYDAVVAVSQHVAHALLRDLTNYYWRQELHQLQLLQIQQQCVDNTVDDNADEASIATDSCVDENSQDNADISEINNQCKLRVDKLCVDENDQPDKRNVENKSKFYEGYSVEALGDNIQQEDKEKVLYYGAKFDTINQLMLNSDSKEPNIEGNKDIHLVYEVNTISLEGNINTVSLEENINTISLEENINTVPLEENINTISLEENINTVSLNDNFKHSDSEEITYSQTSIVENSVNETSLEENLYSSLFDSKDEQDQGEISCFECDDSKCHPCIAQHPQCYQQEPSASQSVTVELNIDENYKSSEKPPKYIPATREYVDETQSHEENYKRSLLSSPFLWTGVENTSSKNMDSEYLSKRMEILVSELDAAIEKEISQRNQISTSPLPNSWFSTPREILKVTKTEFPEKAENSDNLSDTASTCYNEFEKSLPTEYINDKDEAEACECTLQHNCLHFVEFDEDDDVELMSSEQIYSVETGSVSDWLYKADAQ